MHGQHAIGYCATILFVTSISTGLDEHGVKCMQQPDQATQNRTWGFTLIELIIVIAIVVVLASLTVSAYQTFTVRSQVLEGINFASATKAPIVGTYKNSGVPPADRSAAGMTSNASDTQGAFVSQVIIVNGRIDITFGNDAHQDIFGDTLSLTPYLTDGSTISWRCGKSPPPAGSLLTGGGVTAVHLPPTVEERYLPGACR